jgi:hypothetical protein
MNIQTVADNLRNTIAGKEKYRDEVRKMLNDHGNYLTVREKELQMQTESFLVVNIDELKRILKDVEQCEPSLPGEGNNYEKWDGDE